MCCSYRKDGGIREPAVFWIVCREPSTPGLTLTPATLNVRQSGTLTPSLRAPAPTGGVTVTLTSGNANVATLGAPSVTIPAGQQTSGAVTVSAVGPGTATLTATAPGFTDGSATLTVALPAPTVTSFTPTSGRIGDSVTVAGTLFFQPSAVTFGGVAATSFTANSLTSITVTIPAGAATGPIAVTTSAGTGTSLGHFVVLPTQDFQLSALPSSLNVPSAGRAAFTIGMTGAGGFTGLTTLAVTGVPAGATATFAAPTLTVKGDVVDLIDL